MLLALLSIILAIVVAFLIVTLENMFAEESVREHEAAGAGPAAALRNVGRKIKDSFTHNNGWVMGAIIGTVVGVINYITPKLGWGASGIALCFMLVMLGISAYLVYWWHQGGSRFREIVVMSVLALLIFLTTKSTAAMAMTLFSVRFWRVLVMVLPDVAIIGTIGFSIVDALFYNYRESEGEKPALRVLAWIAMIVVTLLLLNALSPCFFALNPGSSNQSVTETEGATLVDRAAMFIAGKVRNTADESKASPTPKMTPKVTPTVTPTAKLDSGNWYKFYNLELQKDKDKSNDYNFGWNCYDESWTAKDYDKEFRSRVEEDPALGAAEMAWLDAKVGTRYIGVFYDECDGAWDKAINTAKERFIKEPPSKLYNPTIDGFFAFLDSAVKVEIKMGSDITDQMYMNPFTVDGVPDVIVMKTSDHEGWFLVYTFMIKDQPVEVAYRIECGFQPCNVEKVMGIKPVQPTAKPTVKPAPKPTATPTVKPTKDPTQGIPSPGHNDDPGPGPNTNTGVGGQHSSEDLPSNSDHMSKEEYFKKIKELSELNEQQLDGNDSNTPTVTASPGTKVSNNGDKGTGNGSINSPTPTKAPVHIVVGDKEQPLSTAPAGQWGGPPD